MKDLITEARELCTSATPGPWTVDTNEPFSRQINGVFADEQEKYVFYHDPDGEDTVSKNDAAFIARSRTLVPELCNALEKAEEQNKQLLHEVCRLACESVERDKALARLEAEVMARLEEHNDAD